MGKKYLKYSRSLIQAAVLTLALTQAAAAQRFVVGGGLNVGSVPRAMAPLCGSARRLNGAGLTGRIGLIAKSVRVTANVDFLAAGSVSVAECVPRTGLGVDSVFEPAKRSATNFSAGVWIPVLDRVEVGAESGIVSSHASWFIGPSIGAQYGNLRLEGTLRRHTTSFDEVTREYGSGTTREISRSSQSEGSWGGTARLLFVLTR